jgi:DNA-binding MurR/RpiR family transcriptional regulator
MFKTRIQDAYDSLSPRFKRLANFILDNTLDVSFLTATELAHRVGVDPATVVRFAQEIGYTGYRELSREIKSYVNEKIALRNRKEVFVQDDIEGQVGQIIDDISDRLLDMKADIKELIKTAQVLTRAHTIYITGTPEGYGLALVWSVYLRLIGLSIQLVKINSIESALWLKDASEKDAIVGITSGLDPSIELSRILDIANAKNVVTIAITASASLRAAREADINLVVNARTPFNYPSFDTISILLSVLWQIIILQKGDSPTQEINQTLDYMDKLLQKSYKKSVYNSANLKRYWQKSQ